MVVFIFQEGFVLFLCVPRWYLLFLFRMVFLFDPGWYLFFVYRMVFIIFVQDGILFIFFRTVFFQGGIFYCSRMVFVMFVPGWYFFIILSRIVFVIAFHDVVSPMMVFLCFPGCLFLFCFQDVISFFFSIIVCFYLFPLWYLFVFNVFQDCDFYLFLYGVSLFVSRMVCFTVFPGWYLFILFQDGIL